MKRPFGLYIHVPFCARLCHYCDFAKTANFQDDHVKQYFSIVVKQLRHWLEAMPDQTFSSVFFGGGTPGLFVDEYRPLFEVFSSRLAHDAEVTLEANPNNVTKDRLTSWRSMGFNRVSIGVQSFEHLGLKSMTRDHSGDEARKSLRLALEIMPKVNGDLIYGWPGQTNECWQRDLNVMTSLGVPHLSLYALTFEGNTPFARAERRGKMSAATDDSLGEYYSAACQELKTHGFDHEEISNWAKPGHRCAHNWLYWSGDYYLGVGAGAHGFVPSKVGFGMRYSYPGDLRQFIKACDQGRPNDGIQIEDDRDLGSWLLEYVGCGLRTKVGIDLNLIRAMGFVFHPTDLLKFAHGKSQVHFNKKAVRLPPTEWFREIGWSKIVLECFKRR